MVAYSIEVKPTAWGGVPRIWEKLKARAGDARWPPSRTPRNARRAEWAMEIGRRWVAAYMDGEVPDDLQAEWDEADEMVFSKIRALLGLDEVESFVVGAAPTPPEVLEFFLAIGIEICETWGMSETSAMTTLNPPGGIRVGTVGPPVPGHRGEAGRGRRGDGARPAGDEGLPQHAREDRRGAHRGRLAADRRRRRIRRGGLPEDRRPQEGADHQRGGQEHVAGQHRGEGEGGLDR